MDGGADRAQRHAPGAEGRIDTAARVEADQGQPVPRNETPPVSPTDRVPRRDQLPVRLQDDAGQPQAVAGEMEADDPSIRAEARVQAARGGRASTAAGMRAKERAAETGGRERQEDKG